jgi:alkanesulfonate monooxygenase
LWLLPAWGGTLQQREAFAMAHDKPLEFVSMIFTRDGADWAGARSSREVVVDKVYTGTLARAHEHADFDRVLVGYGSTGHDGFQVIAYAAQQTEKLKFLLAHRPGFVAPTLAARQIATLDQFIDGRLAIHIITGGSSDEQARDGDFVAHDDRYERTDEYLDVLKLAWTSPKPFDYEGKYYKIKGNPAAIRPLQKPHLPIYFGGASEPAVKVAAKHADVYALWGESLAEVKERLGQVKAAAAVHGRENHIRFSVSFRPVLGKTEEEAWARAERILERAKAQRQRQEALGFVTHRGSSDPVEAVGAQRLQAIAARGKVVDKRLWTEMTALGGGGGNSTSLVGTPEQVAESLLEYWELGVSTLLIRGWDPLEDTIDYGRNLIPLLREEVRRRQAALAA